MLDLFKIICISKTRPVTEVNVFRNHKWNPSKYFVFLLLFGCLSYPLLSGACALDAFDFVIIPPESRKLEMVQGSRQEVQSSNRFRKAYNSGTIRDSDRYVLYNNIPGKIIGAEKHKLILEIVTLSGERKVITIAVNNYNTPIMTSQMAKEFFRSLGSDLTTVHFPGPKEIPTETEQSLKEKGHGPIFYAGVDATNILLQLGLFLKTAKIHPFRTHIPPYEYQIDNTIAHIKRGIESQSEEVQSRLEILKQFEREIKAKAAQSQLTYAYWIMFHYRLSYLVTPPSKRGTPNFKSWMTEDGLTEYMNIQYPRRNPVTGFQSMVQTIYMFPEVVSMPTISGLGFMAINNTTATGVAIVELANRRKNTLFPDKYLEHDFNHTLMGYANKRDTLKSLHEQLKARLRNAPPIQREMVDFVYFLAHDKPQLIGLIQFIGRGTNRSKLVKELSRIYDTKNKVPFNTENIETFIEESVSFFAQTVSEMAKEQSL